MLLSFAHNLSRYSKLRICSTNEHFSGLEPTDIARIRQLSYIKQWQTLRENQHYHIRLDDQSLLLFQNTAGKESFSFLPCPLDVPSQSVFLAERYPDVRPSKALVYLDDYELAVLTAEAKTHVTPIRLDSDPTAYRPTIHPVKHLHFGIENHIRIATRRSWTPQAFLLFVIRQAYPRNWEILLERKEDLKIERWIRADLPMIESNYWQVDDELQHYLS